MSSAQECNVLEISLSRYRRPSGLKATDAELETVLRHHLRSLRRHIVDEFFDIEHARRRRGFEFRVASKHDRRNDRLGRKKVEDRADCLYMTAVLTNGVLKAVLHPNKDLGSSALLFATEDPARVVFRLYYEDSMPGTKRSINPILPQR